MSERGFTLVEAILSLGVMAIVLASAMEVVVVLPRQAARWEEAADARQRLRVIHARGARLAGSAGPIEVPVGGVDVRVPSIWPRRLGLIDAGVPGDVSSRAVTFVSRADGHRTLRLDEALGSGGGTVAVVSGEGCGTSTVCGVAAADMLMAVSAASDIGLFRVTATENGRLTLVALMAGSAFAAGSALLPVTMASLAFAEGEIRLYDGYRTDGVLVDGVARFALGLEPAGLRLDDGPWVGSGPLAFDADQLLVRGVSADVALEPGGEASAERALLFWGLR